MGRSEVEERAGRNNTMARVRAKAEEGTALRVAQGWQGRRRKHKGRLEPCPVMFPSL